MRAERFYWLGGLAVTAVVIGAALMTGPAETTRGIVLQIRLPRVLLGLMVGMGLAVAGALLQSLLRNALADPYILGTSSGASFGVLVASVLHIQFPLGVQSIAFAMALATMAAVYRIARVGYRVPVSTLILSGVIVSTFLNALVFLAFSLFHRESFSALIFLLGSLSNATPTHAAAVAVFVLPAIALACRYARVLDVLSQGEDTAWSLGVNPERWKKAFFILASLLVAAAVTASGMIGFVGLVAPHLIRLAMGPGHARLVPASALGGGILLVAMDMIARTAAAPAEIPVGVVAALFGTPFFVFLLRRQRGLA